jgi:hypothetical protein
VIRALAIVSFAASLLLAQQPPRVQPDPASPVADALLGAWRLDPDLTARLGRSKAPKEITFRADASVLERLPAAAAEHLAGRRVYAAGLVRVGGRDDLWLLTDAAGAPSLVVCRDRGAGAAGDVEVLTVMLVRAAAPDADLLFANGDPGRQPFAAYSRVQPQAVLEPSAALTDMARLLETGDHAAFLRTYVLPEDLTKMQHGGRTLEALAADFAERKAKEALASLLAAAKLTPAIDEAAGEAVYTGDGLPRPLRLRRVGTRWFVCNR